MAASVVLVAPRRLGTIIAGAAPRILAAIRSAPTNHRRRLPATVHCHTQRRTSCWRRSSTPQVDLACSSLSTGSPSAQRAMPLEPPSPQLLKPDCCRAPPLARAASPQLLSQQLVRRTSRAREMRTNTANAAPSPQLLKPDCCRAPPPSSRRLTAVVEPAACAAHLARTGNANEYG